MVDPVGPKTVASDLRLAPVSPVRAPLAPQPTVQDAAVRADPSTLKALAAPLASSPPVDAERVARIKKAVQDGNFPLVPSTIADRLLALKLQWKPHDDANQPS